MKKNLVILTGAGISAESGIKTFRDSDGLWEKYRVEDVATPMAWKKDPALVLNFYNERRKDVLKAVPNAAHFALTKLEDFFKVTVFTQYIDDLHERAGSKNVLHLHGQILKSRSSADEDLLYDCSGDIHLGDTCELGSQLRPHVVWFHEPVPMMEHAAKIAAAAELFLVIGTSLQVYPAAGLINYAPYFSHKFLVDPVLPDITPIHQLKLIAAKATAGVPPLVEKLIEEFL